MGFPACRGSRRSVDRVDLDDALVRLWILRLLVPLEGYKSLLRDRQFIDDAIARAVGLDRYVDQEDGEYDRGAILLELRKKWSDAEQTPPPISEDTLLARNLAAIADMLGLSAAETRMVHFIVAVKQDPLIETATNLLGSMSLSQLEQVFVICLDLDPEVVRSALAEDGALNRTGILSLHLDGSVPFHMKADLLRGLADELHRHHDDPLGLFRNNLTRTPAPKLTPDHYPHLARDIVMLRRFITDAMARRRPGTNFLVYGLPGTGKTEFVRMLAESLGLPLYEVATENHKGEPLDGEERFRAYRLAQWLLGRGEAALILFDEIEDVFRDTGDELRRKGNRSGRKGWVNRLLEGTPVPAFWLSNNLWFVDPACIRRFDYVIEMNCPPRSVRARVLDEYLADLPVSEDWKRRMAEHDRLVPAVVERAANLVRSVKDELPPAETEQALARAMGNTLEALRLPRAPVHYAARVTDYRLDILNADCDLGEVRDRLSAVRQGRICLYGPPGSGKTAFGQHIAETLDMPLLVRRASDIVSPFLGVTEWNTARMFREAAEDGAVLLLDEADSFLQDRQGAQRNWEISEVNEMLTQMDSFEGMFIASTNLMQSLDSAALRRFDLKIRFDYLNPEQVWTMFADTARGLGFEADEAIRPALARLGLLTPGDFATVLRQARLRKVEDSRGLYRRLAAECGAKPEGRKRPIGF